MSEKVIREIKLDLPEEVADNVPHHVLGRLAMWACASYNTVFISGNYRDPRIEIGASYSNTHNERTYYIAAIFDGKEWSFHS